MPLTESDFMERIGRLMATIWDLDRQVTKLTIEVATLKATSVPPAPSKEP